MSSITMLGYTESPRGKPHGPKYNREIKRSMTFDHFWPLLLMHLYSGNIGLFPRWWSIRIAMNTSNHSLLITEPNPASPPSHDSLQLPSIPDGILYNLSRSFKNLPFTSIIYPLLSRKVYSPIACRPASTFSELNNSTF